MTTATTNRIEWLTPAEAAEAMGIVVGTLQNWRSQGKENQPKFYKSGSIVRYKRTDVDAWIESNSVTF